MKATKRRHQPWILEDIAFYVPTLLAAQAAYECIRRTENLTEPFGTILLASGRTINWIRSKYLPASHPCASSRMHAM
jgi:hypothetical protein